MTLEELAQFRESCDLETRYPCVASVTSGEASQAGTPVVAESVWGNEDHAFLDFRQVVGDEELSMAAAVKLALAAESREYFLS